MSTKKPGVVGRTCDTCGWWVDCDMAPLLEVAMMGEPAWCSAWKEADE